MSSGLDAFKAFVAELRSRCDLVDVVGRDIELRRVGNVMKGLSPFHSEKHASFVVWPATQTWRDYSAGGSFGGDVFSYVQAREKLTFKDAVLVLAERVGIQPPNQDHESWQRALTAAAERRYVEHLLTAAARYYHRRLPEAIRTSHFKQRYGFTDDAIDQHQLGWADGRLFEHLTRARVSRRAALATGLFVLLEGGRVIDFYVNRLVFPYWRDGRVVYFTARATELTPATPWEQAKYKKLRTHGERQPYISKTVRNDYFFNEDAARGADELVITEGVPDCVSASQCGIPCISPGTTSLRGQDVPRILELTRDVKRVVICNDAETSGAGEASAIATASRLWEHGREACIAQIPRPADVEKVDLNDFATAHGEAALRAVISEALPYPEFLLSRIPHDTPKPELERLLNPVLAALAHCSSIRADIVLDATAARLSVRRRTLVARMKELASPKRKAAGPPATPPQPPFSVSGSGPHPLPQIRVNGRQLRDVVSDTWSALHAANTGPQLFVRSGRLVHVVHLESGAQVAAVSESELYGLASAIANWVRVTPEAAIGVNPMKEAVRDVFVRPEPTLPSLEAVVSAPFFDADGALISTPGYHAHARVWYRADGLQVAPVPERPTDDDIAAARTLLLDELLVDFPFTAMSDRAQAVGALLLPFARRLIPECTPIHLLEAPSPGSGKGLLADVICLLNLGTAAMPTTITQDEDEVRKKITAILHRAQPVIVLDNIKDTLDSAQLAAAITSEVWSDRVLGETRMIELPNRATWIATANNLELSMEVARRCVRVRIDAHVDRPWLRAGFRHDPLKPWVREHRGELVHALLVLIQAWLAAGRKPSGRNLGSFDAWARTIGGILDHAGIPGFLEDTNVLYEAADIESQEWRGLMAAWWSRYRSLWVSTSELLALVLENEVLGTVLGNGRDTQSQKMRLGKALSRLRDRHFGQLRIEIGRNSHVKAAQYRLVDVTEQVASGGVDAGQLAFDTNVAP